MFTSVVTQIIGATKIKVLFVGKNYVFTKWADPHTYFGTNLYTSCFVTILKTVMTFPVVYLRKWASRRICWCWNVPMFQFSSLPTYFFRSFLERNASWNMCLQSLEISLTSIFFRFGHLLFVCTEKRQCIVAGWHSVRRTIFSGLTPCI